ncbi:DUF72 domain-containing protein [Peribacillus tepidiphilus]|uniref:DUF72 domain-containing protein n=1 Tax=Peribacillus tepidiphilus TaxID=2652445 RepID=UPI0012917916|nr:DUF72 domain-containing protein [Peribacillus tepidiphilus]
MIKIGVTGWGDHDSLYTGRIAQRDKLKEYASHFPIVEVDAAFYAIQPKRNAEKWVSETPKAFEFIVKAYQGMTGHQRGEIPFESREAMFAAFRDSLTPYQEANKLAMVLFQFPPWFDCRKENVEYLRWCKCQMEGIPTAIEFRNQSWYSPRFKEGTISFLKEQGWIHSVCDEPQAGEGSIPFVPIATTKDKTLVRLHGRNVHGWQKPAEGNWREVRFLYRYNKAELDELKDKLCMLKKQTKELYVLFNNNSGGDAADNAKEMIDLLQIQYKGLAPKQLDLF